MRLQPTSSPHNTAAARHGQRHGPSAIDTANAIATAACELGNPLPPEWPSHSVPRPSMKGRGAATLCLSSAAAAQARPMPSSASHTVRRPRGPPSAANGSSAISSTAGSHRLHAMASHTSASGASRPRLSHRNTDESSVFTPTACSASMTSR